VLLDVGGVLVDLDGMPSLATLLNSAESGETLHERWMASKAVIAHESGQISASEFAERLTVELRLPIPPCRFLKAFRVWPRSLRPGALELLDRIPPEYVVAALSNTSAVHWERINALGLAGRFRRTYLSFETGHLKPGQEAFHVALADMGAHPSEVLFFDDSDANVHVAQRLGIDAHLAEGPHDVEQILHDYGILRMGA
jgi:putative hydrolase of the HAD superfamily